MTSSGFAATAAGLRAAADRAAAAAEEARDIQLGAIAGLIGAALRGTRSAAAAAELATAWDTAMAAWSTEVTAHGRRLSDSATTYQASDAEATERFLATDPEWVR